MGLEAGYDRKAFDSNGLNLARRAGRSSSIWTQGNQSYRFRHRKGKIEGKQLKRYFIFLPLVGEAVGTFFD